MTKVQLVSAIIKGMKINGGSQTNYDLYDAVTIEKIMDTELIFKLLTKKDASRKRVTKSV